MPRGLEMPMGVFHAEDLEVAMEFLESARKQCTTGLGMSGGPKWHTPTCLSLMMMVSCSEDVQFYQHEHLLLAP